MNRLFPLVNSIVEVRDPGDGGENGDLLCTLDISSCCDYVSFCDLVEQNVIGNSLAKCAFARLMVNASMLEILPLLDPRQKKSR